MYTSWSSPHDVRGDDTGGFDRQAHASKVGVLHRAIEGRTVGKSEPRAWICARSANEPKFLSVMYVHTVWTSRGRAAQLAEVDVAQLGGQFSANESSESTSILSGLTFRRGYTFQCPGSEYTVQQTG